MRSHNTPKFVEEWGVIFHGERSGAMSLVDLSRQRGQNRHRGRRALPSVGRPARRETGKRLAAGWRGMSPRGGLMRTSPGRARWREPRVWLTGWRGTSPRKARSPRRSPVRRSGVPCVRSRKSRSLSRSRGESRRVCRESPAVVRVTQHGRLPRRKAPQKCLRQDSAAVRCVRVWMEEVRSQSEVVREEGKSTLEEVKMVVCEEGMAGAIEKTEEERRVVIVEERAGVKKETGDSTAGTTAICDICRVPWRLLIRHMDAIHLPWFFWLENSCWKCQWAECSSLHLEKRRWKCHEDEGKFTDQRLITWRESVKIILVLLSRQSGKAPESLGEFVSAKGWLQGMEPTVIWGSSWLCTGGGQSRLSLLPLWVTWQLFSTWGHDTSVSWGARGGWNTGAPGTTGGRLCRSLAWSCSHRCSWCISELARELPSSVHLGHLPSAMLQLSWQGWRQWSLTPFSGMSGLWEFQHQLGTSGCSKPGAYIPRQWKMSIGAGWSRNWQHLNVWLWVSVDWTRQPGTWSSRRRCSSVRSSLLIN